MIVDKSVIAAKLAKLKIIIPNKLISEEIQSIQGVLYKDNSLYVTNLDVSIKAVFENNSKETFIIPSRAISLIESLPKENIEIIPEPNFSIRIKTKHINNKFQSYDPSTFPDMNLTGSAETAIVKINNKELENGIKSVIYAVGNNELKPALAGVYFESSNGVLNIVGCDGYRMSWYKTEYEREFKLNVPKEAVQKVISVGMAGDISILSDQKSAIFESDEYTIYTRLLEGNYINYESMLKKRGNSTIINRLSFIEALKRCMLCMDEKNKGIVKLQLNGEKVIISANSVISEYTEEVKLETSIDESLTIGFNGVYLLDFLNGFESENLELDFGTAHSPLIADDSKQSALVLPLKL